MIHWTSCVSVIYSINSNSVSSYLIHDPTFSIKHFIYWDCSNMICPTYISDVHNLALLFLPNILHTFYLASLLFISTLLVFTNNFLKQFQILRLKYNEMILFNALNAKPIPCHVVNNMFYKSSVGFKGQDWWRLWGLLTL